MEYLLRRRKIEKKNGATAKRRNKSSLFLGICEQERSGQNLVESLATVRVAAFKKWRNGGKRKRDMEGGCRVIAVQSVVGRKKTVKAVVPFSCLLQQCAGHVFSAAVQYRSTGLE